jgi:hypothetical protein
MMSSKPRRLTRRHLLATLGLPAMFRMGEGAACAQTLNRNSAPT